MIISMIAGFLCQIWLPKIPLKELDTDFGYLEKKKNVEVRDTAFCYFLHVVSIPA